MKYSINTINLQSFMMYIIMLLLSVPTISYSQRHQIFSQHIASLQVIAGDDWQAMPIVELEGGQSLNISFDDMTHEYHRYSYKIEHCEADWQPTESLFTSDYLAGFNEHLVIEDYEQSLNTNHLYTHYKLTLPNEYCRITMSGNYRLTVYDEDNDNDPVLSVCFMVVEPLMSVLMDVNSNTDIDVNRSHQQVSMAIDYAPLRVSDPARQVKIVVLQNGRWDNAVFSPQPDYQLTTGMKWQHCQQLIFPAGNVYRKFEMLDFNTTTMGLSALKWDGEEYHAYVAPDEPRPSYVYDEAAQGAFLLRNSDNIDNDFTSDYAWVHFTLVSDLLPYDVYLNGQWTYDNFLPQYSMTYNAEKRAYEATILLKQGYYSYQYLMVTPEGKTLLVPSEGNFYETNNSYSALVYYRGNTDRTDRLVGYTKR